MGHSTAYSETYSNLLQDVQSVATLQTAREGGRPPGDTGPLRRSIVVLHTAWENYVEEVAVEGSDFYFASIGSDHSLLPHPLRSKLGSLKNPWGPSPVQVGRQKHVLWSPRRPGG